MTLGADTIVIVRAALATSGHGKRRDWTDAIETTVTGCSVQPYQTTEATADREFASSHVRLFAPHGTDLRATDRVTFDGQQYEVDGEPGKWRDDGGAGSHIEASLKRLVG